MDTGGCSIYRELLRLHFSDEQKFCEDGILAEVLFYRLYILPQQILLFMLIAHVQVQKINAHGDGVDFELATIGWLLHK